MEVVVTKDSCPYNSDHERHECIPVSPVADGPNQPQAPPTTLLGPAQLAPKNSNPKAKSAGSRFTQLFSRLVTREVKLVAVVNRSLPLSKAAICTVVSTATIRLYQQSCQDPSFAPTLSQYLNWGQMKVVVKAPSSAELYRLESVVKEGGAGLSSGGGCQVQSVLLYTDDRALQGALTTTPLPNKHHVKHQVLAHTAVPSTPPPPAPVVFCVLASVPVVDAYTKHLKLL